MLRIMENPCPFTSYRTTESHLPFVSGFLRGIRAPDLNSFTATTMTITFKEVFVSSL